MNASGWYGFALLVLAWLCKESQKTPLQKVWWVFFGCWIVSCFLNRNVDYPAVLADRAALDLVCMAFIVVVLWGNGFRNTLSGLLTLFSLMLASHAAWAAMLHFNLAPDLTSTNYYHQAVTNVLTALTYLLIGGRCVPLVIGAFRDRNSADVWRVSRAGGRK